MRSGYFVLLMCLALPIAALQDSASVEDRAKRIVELLLAQDHSVLEENYTPQMKEGFAGEFLSGTVIPQIQSMGAVQTIGKPEVEKKLNMVIAIVPVSFALMDVHFQIAFNQAGEVAGLFLRSGDAASANAWKPPPYSKPDTFHSVEITVGESEWRLPGTLTLPNGEGPHPAVVLVQGSGPQDRDETVGAAKPFRDLAEGLASRGIAVLRYEKRTKQHQSRLARYTELTVQEETIEDAIIAADLLRNRKDIEDDSVFVLGHSLGGYVAPRIARQDTKLAGLIILAGNTRPVEDLVIEQTAYLASLSGDLNEEQKRQLEDLRETVERIRSLEAGEESTAAILGAPLSYWMDLKGYDPASEASSLPLPMLILQGERDYQVTMADFEGWKRALADRKDATFHSYPSLNHLFQPGEGASTPAEYSRPGHVAASVINDIADWIAGL